MDLILTTTHPRAQCLDLRTMVAGVYRCGWDEAYHAERPDLRRVEAAWLTVIPCRYGRIYPMGGTRLGVSVTMHALSAVLAIPGARVVQRGSGEATVTVDGVYLDRVAVRLGARRVRVLSPERRRVATARLALYRDAKRRQISTTAAGEGGECPPPDENRS